MPKHIIIIGAVALGSKAAARFKRLEPDSRVTLVDRDKLIAYSGCGIPYYVSGEVNEERELQSTAFHMLRDTEFFRKTKGVDVRIETEAMAIDRIARTVTLRHLPTGNEEILAYDQLVLATGSTPFQLRVPGTALQGVHTVQDPESARQIRSRIAGGKVKRAVVIGAGFIGMEMAVALADLWDIPTTVIEYRDQILPGVIGNNLARMAQRRMEEKGITFLLGEQAKAFESDDQTHVARVVTETTTLLADLVIVAVGVRPSTALARQAGLEVSERGAVQVDEYLRTSDPHIFAGGDCVELRHLLTDTPVYLPMGSLANRQGRIIGDNLAGGGSRFPEVAGSWCVKLFDLSAAGTGLTLQGAKNAGFEALSVHVSQLDRAHFFPEKGLMSLELIIERDTGRILGLQGLADMGDALVGKVNVLAALLSSAPKARMLSSLEMAYSPPFSAALDILNVLGNVADNILANRYRGIHADEFAAMWKEREHNDLFFLDCRETLEAEKYAHAHPSFWHNIPQGELAGRLQEIPENHGLVLICNTGARAYEAVVTLKNANFNDVVCVEGGMTALTAAGVQV